MRILAFLANCKKHHAAVQHENSALSCQTDATTPQQCQMTADYVSQVLRHKLQDFGFSVQEQASSLSEHALSVSVDDHPVQLSVCCRSKDIQGQLQCEISAQSEEAPDWFGKIATQSMTKQLAQAVEQSLKNEGCFDLFQWQDSTG